MSSPQGVNHHTKIIKHFILASFLSIKRISSSPFLSLHQSSIQSQKSDKLLNPGSSLFFDPNLNLRKVVLLGKETVFQSSKLKAVCFRLDNKENSLMAERVWLYRCGRVIARRKKIRARWKSARQRKEDWMTTSGRYIEMYRCIPWKPSIVMATVSIPVFMGYMKRSSVSGFYTGLLIWVGSNLRHSSVWSWMT